MITSRAIRNSNSTYSRDLSSSSSTARRNCGKANKSSRESKSAKRKKRDICLQVVPLILTILSRIHCSSILSSFSLDCLLVCDLSVHFFPGKLLPEEGKQKDLDAEGIRRPDAVVPDIPAEEYTHGQAMMHIIMAMAKSETDVVDTPALDIAGGMAEEGRKRLVTVVEDSESMLYKNTLSLCNSDVARRRDGFDIT